MIGRDYALTEMIYRFWKKTSEHCPETRIEISNQQRKVKKSSEKQKTDQPKRVRKLFADCGRPFNINEARIPFRMIDERDRYELNVEVYRYATKGKPQRKLYFVCRGKP